MSYKTKQLLTLQDFKDKTAAKHGYKDWDTLESVADSYTTLLDRLEESAELYVRHHTSILKEENEKLRELLLVAGGALEKLRGIEAWIGDHQMKVFFQRLVYPITKQISSLLTK